MKLTNAQRAHALVHALPYIKNYTGKILVVKYGGNAMKSETLKKSVMRDLVLLHEIGVRVVLVHGGGPELSELLQKTGKQSEFVNGLRVTDAETAEAALMVLAGKVNKSLVTLIENTGAHAVGLSGADGMLIEARQKDPALGFVGEIEKIRPRVITDLLEKGYIPVVSTVGADRAGNIYNVNADTAAAHIAGALGAETLITMTDIAGVLRDKNDPDTLIPHITLAEAAALTESGVIVGGMIPKTECCLEAVRRGVRRVFIIDGTIPHAILLETLTDEGLGTMFTE